MALAEGIASERRSLEEVHGSVEVPAALGRAQRLRRLFAFLGPAYLVSVGYMDPGNWATDLEGGARFGYALLWVFLMSNLMAVLLQTLAARLGVVTGHDLAQACRAEYSRGLNAVLWVLAEVAIAATDLAEILGTIIALKLLFGLPLLWGCLITAFDTFVLLYLQRWGMRQMEAVILALVATIGGVFPCPDLPGQARHGGNLFRVAAQLAARRLVRGDRHSGCHGHAAQPVLALGSGADPPDRQRRPEQAVGVPLLPDRRGDRPQRGVFRQRGDPDPECGGLSPAWTWGSPRSRKHSSCFAAVARSRCADLVRHRPLVCRPELDLDRYSRRPDRDGRLSPPAPGTVAAPPDHASARP